MGFIIKSAAVVVGLAVAIGVALSVYNAPNPAYERPFTVVDHSDNVEALLAPYKELIGDDYPGYRGHIYRVLSYTLHILGGDSDHRAAIEHALVYHDIGLWTAGVLAYLEPSAEAAKAAEEAQQFSPEELQLIDDIIVFHHKVWPFEGPFADVVNAARQADWIDASQGTITKGMPREYIAQAYDAIPVDGFYQTLQEFGSRLHGWNVPKAMYETSKILRW